jgi:putative transposase
MGKVHLLPGTTFSSVADKGDWDPESTATLTLSELEQWLATAIVGVYHKDIHRTLGSTPAAAWAHGLAIQGQTRARMDVARNLDPRRLLIDFLPVLHRHVRREGVILHSIAYWSSVLTTWIGCEASMAVHYDPRDLSRVYLKGTDSAYYDLAYRDLRRPPISLWEHHAARRQLQGEARGHVNEAAIFGAIDAMRRIAANASTETKTLRRLRERRRHLIDSGRPPPLLICQEVPTPALKMLPPEMRLFQLVEDWS